MKNTKDSYFPFGSNVVLSAFKKPDSYSRLSKLKRKPILSKKVKKGDMFLLEKFADGAIPGQTILSWTNGLKNNSDCGYYENEK